jgi:hypothetical protein
MTKKRFIKLLMSHGEQISQARKIALYYNSRKIPYATAYPSYRLENSFKKLGEASKRMSVSLNNLTKAINKFANTIT